MSELLDAACEYANRGWAVFPVAFPAGDGCSCGQSDCSSPAKHPYGRLAPRGFRNATRDPEVIRAWWTTEPRANIGIATGTVSGIVVADIDGRAGEDAFERLNAGRPIDPTVTAHTGGGGLHYYYAHPGEPISNSARRLGAELDVRGDGGFVVAPPSIHASGQQYVWLRSEPLALMPDWLRPPPTPLRDPLPLRPTRPLVGDGSNYGLAALKGEVATMRAAAVGSRNDTLNTAAFNVARLVLSGDLHAAHAASELLSAAVAVGLGDAEARRTIASAFTARRAS